MAFVVLGGVDVDLDELDLGVVEVAGDSLGGDEHVVASGHDRLPPCWAMDVGEYPAELMVGRLLGEVNTGRETADCLIEIAECGASQLCGEAVTVD
jgi:hypothetical protein